jgi:hypothetical protein
MATKECVKGILQALTQTLAFLPNDAEFAEVRRRPRLVVENGFSLAAPKGDWTCRQEQIGLDASSEPGNLAECI